VIKKPTTEIIQAFEMLTARYRVVDVTLFPPQPEQGDLIFAHNDPRVRAADEGAPAYSDDDVTNQEIRIPNSSSARNHKGRHRRWTGHCGTIVLK